MRLVRAKLPGNQTDDLPHRGFPLLFAILIAHEAGRLVSSNSDGRVAPSIIPLIFNICVASDIGPSRPPISEAIVSARC